MILMTARLWKQLGMQDDVQLELNSLGSLEARKAYRDILVEYLEQHKAILDEDSQRRLTSNPLRILDSKNPHMQAMIEAAPKLAEHLDNESREHFEALCKLLDNAGIEYVINQRLVRGLDYYSKTVFEWTTSKLGAQGTICAGGRFDGLVEQLGGKATPAMGFALGIERLVALLEDDDTAIIDNTPHAYLLMAGEQAEQQGFALAEKLRDEIVGLRLLSHCGGGSFKSQMKKADKSGAQVALILGEDEIINQLITVKDLRGDKGQQQITLDDLNSYMSELVYSV
jgi:histidyl-tRNA synthetase